MKCFSLRLLLASALAVLVLATGCGDDSDSTPSGSPDPASQTLPPATTDIDPVTGLPRSFPKDFPVLAGATVSRASEYSDRYVIEWRTTDTYDAAVEYYASALAATPWQANSTDEAENATVFDIAGGSTTEYGGSLAVATVDDGVRILLNLIRE